MECAGKERVEFVVFSIARVNTMFCPIFVLLPSSEAVTYFEFCRNFMNGIEGSHNKILTAQM